MRRREEQTGELQTFTLRREPRALTWAELCSPERTAVGALLLRLAAYLEYEGDARGGQGAATRERDRARVAANFLVSGERGTGKTTVLFSAKLATEDPARFFADPGDAPRSFGGFTLQQLERMIKEKLKPSLLFLPFVDMEFFPKNANLLTTLLVQISSALDGGEEAARRNEEEAWYEHGARSHLLEEGLDGASAAISNLIERGTLMWEGVNEADSRVRAQRQIDAVETFARFKEDLTEALRRVTRALQRRFCRSSDLVLVLPIDNADRGADQLFEILKLLRLATAPQLCYVVAANQSDIDVFVDRSYRRDLGVERDESRIGAATEQLRGIARRQAATTQRTVLPPAHRIDIGAVPAREAFRFSIDRRRTLGALLRDIELSWPERARAQTERERDQEGKLSLFDLMVLDRRLSDEARSMLARAAEKQRRCEGTVAADPDVGGTGEPSGEVAQKKSNADKADWLSDAGACALTLPVRNLADLWQSACYWSAPDCATDQPCGERAINMVCEVLMNLTAESELPEWASRLIRERIIERSHARRVLLDYRRNPVKWKARFSIRNQLALPNGDSDGRGPSSEGGLLGAPSAAAGRVQERIKSNLLLNDFYGYALELQQPGSRETAEMPPRVRGWFMLLHDLLTQAPGPRVAVSASTRSADENPMIVRTEHVICSWAPSDNGPSVVKAKLPWPVPTFEVFDDFELLTKQWKAFLEAALPLDAPFSPSNDPTILPRLLAAAWLDNICSVVSSTRPKWDWHGAVLGDQVTAGDVDKYEQHVADKLDELLKWSTGELPNDQPRISARTLAARSWLLRKSLLLLLPEYLWRVQPTALLTHTLAPAAGSLRAAGQKQWPQPTSHLGRTWAERELDVSLRRFFALRDAVLDSDEYQKRAEQLKAGGDSAAAAAGIAQLNRWVRDICERWFAAIAPAEGDATRARRERFDWIDEYAPPSVEGH